MIPHLFYDQLVVLGLLGLFIIVYYVWSSGWVTGRQRPTTPLTPRRKRCKEPTPFVGSCTSIVRINRLPGPLVVYLPSITTEGGHHGT
jgi:hypothetical protein